MALISVEMPYGPNARAAAPLSVSPHSVYLPRLRWGSGREEQLVTKIERMQRDQVSTPDILGVLTGAEDLSLGLVELDPEDRGLETASG
jgi:hypothetical protein